MPRASSSFCQRKEMQRPEPSSPRVPLPSSRVLLLHLSPQMLTIILCIVVVVPLFHLQHQLLLLPRLFPALSHKLPLASFLAITSSLLSLILMARRGSFPLRLKSLVLSCSMERDTRPYLHTLAWDHSETIPTPS